MDYRYLGSDLDTEDKLRAYLSPAFTEEAIYYYMETAGIKEIDGKLLQPDADGGSLLDWNQATATLYIDDAYAAEYDVNVPYEAGDTVEMSKIRVNFAYEDGAWKIASNPLNIY